MSKKLIIGISLALVLIGAVVLTVLLVRSRSLTDETPIDGVSTGTDGGTSTGGLGGTAVVPGGSTQGGQGATATTTPQGGPCGDGVCSEGESWCKPDCGDAEEKFLGSIKTIAVTSTSITLAWETGTASTGEVSYGLTERYELGTVASPSSKTSHEVQIKGLTPGTNYYVRVRATEEGGTVREAASLSFETTGAP